MPPPEVLTAESWVYDRLLPGPAACISTEDARHLDLLRFPASPSLSAHCNVLAPQPRRASSIEDVAAGGFQAVRQATQLDLLETGAAFEERLAMVALV